MTNPGHITANQQKFCIEFIFWSIMNSADEMEFKVEGSWKNVWILDALEWLKWSIMQSK